MTIEKRIEKRLKDKRLTERQRETLKRFDKEKVATGKGSSPRTRLSYVQKISELGRACPKPYEEMNKQDLIDFLAGKKMADSTRTTYVICLKRFFRWLYWLPKSQYPEQVSWMENKTVKCKVTKSDLITGNELKRMIAVAIVSRDRAIPANLWETAFRASEFLGMKIGDLEEASWGDAWGFRATCRVSKTETRTVPIVQTTYYLARYLNEHPYRDDPEAPLWISLSKNSFGQQIKTIWTLDLITKRLARLAGIKKRIYPHLFRHSRLTDLVRMGMLEGALRRHAGWSPTSNMPALYTHLSGMDVERSTLRASGVKMEPERPVFETKVCPRCRYINDPIVTYCERCGTKIDRPAPPKPKIQDMQQLREEIWERLVTVDKFIEQEKKAQLSESLDQPPFNRIRATSSS